MFRKKKLSSLVSSNYLSFNDTNLNLAALQSEPIYHPNAKQVVINLKQESNGSQLFQHDTLRRNLGFKIRSFCSAAKFPRNSAFSEITSEDIKHFEDILGEKNAIQDEDRLSTANSDWMKKYVGSSKLLLTPGSTEEVPIHHPDGIFFSIVLFDRLFYLYFYDGTWYINLM